MKYEIKQLSDEEQFKPFSLTLTFETKEEYVYFHDNVLGVITKKQSHQFVGDFFNVGSSIQSHSKADGEI